MLNKDKISGPPLTHYIFGVFLTFAAAFIAIIPSAMVYRLRVFEGMGLPDWLYETASMTILLALPVSVLGVGFVRIFAVSDQAHANYLKLAYVLEGLALLFETAASQVLGTGFWVQTGLALTLGIGLVCAFAAIGVALTTSGFYRMAVAQSERTVLWNDSFNGVFREVMESEAIRSEMVAVASHILHKEAENMTGRRMFDGPPAPVAVPRDTTQILKVPNNHELEPSHNGNGNGKGPLPNA